MLYTLMFLCMYNRILFKYNKTIFRKHQRHIIFKYIQHNIQNTANLVH